MATVIRDLLVRLGVSADNKSAMNFDRAVQGVKRSLVAAAASAAALTAGLFTLVKRVANAGDEAAKTARRLGTTAEAVQELGFVADITGTSVGAIETSIRRMTRVVNDADQGLETAQRTLRQLGVNTKDANGETKDSVDLFEEFVGALGGVESQVQRSALAQEVFGRAGTQMLTMIDDQGASIGDLRREAQDLGLVMSNEAAAASEEFNDSLTRFFTIITGIKNQIGIALMPTLTHTINRFRAWIGANRDIIQQRIDRVIERIGAAFGKLADKAKDLDALIRATVGWETVLTTVASAIAAIGVIKFAPAIMIAVKGVVAIFSLLGIKIIAIIAIFVGLVLVIQDLITHFRGGESVIGDLIGRFDLLGGRIGRMIDIVRQFATMLMDTLRPAFDALMDAVRAFGRLFSAAAQLWWAIASRWFGLIADVVLWWWENVMLPIWSLIAPVVNEVLTTVFEFFSMIFDSIAEVLEFFLAVAVGDFDSFGEIVDAALQVVQNVFQNAFDFIGGVIQRRLDTIRSAFEAVFGWIGRQIDSVLGRFDGAMDRARSIPGLGRLIPGGGGDGAADTLARRPRAQAAQNTALAMTGGQTAITVNGSGAPEQVAGMVGDLQQDIWQRTLRQAQEAFGGGEL